MKIKQGEKSYIQMPVEIKSVNKDMGTLDAIFSTQDVDRHGDVVMQEGWDLKHFKKNPVILNSHNYGDATEVIGKASNVKIEDGKLVGKITFAVAENPKAKVIFDLYAGGFLSAFSVGFIPKKFKENKDGSKDWWTIEEAELLEVSAVSVPANARALAKAKGIDVDELPQHEDDESTEPGTEQDEPEGDDDELSEGDEVPEADEEKPADNSDDSEGEPAESDEEAEEHPGDAGDQQDVSPEEEVKPIVASYKHQVASALQRINDQERARLKKVAEIVDNLLTADKPAMEQIRKRKVNQAIRMLMKSK
ncbi:TPA: hypothetical protein DEB29_03430 [Candidatus Wolfebacteria bacterium]|nr:hypothetical protein [Candidatus Wolfebacteria bacterium]